MQTSSKKMGFPSLVMMGIGYIIGTGVFTMLPSVIGMTGRSVCMAMLLAAVVSISSTIFSNIENYGAYAYSIHPMLAISSKYNSLKIFKKHLLP